MEPKLTPSLGWGQGWGHLGDTWGLLGSSWGHLGNSWGIFGTFGTIFGTMFGPLWDYFGVSLGPSWGLGPKPNNNSNTTNNENSSVKRYQQVSRGVKTHQTIWTCTQLDKASTSTNKCQKVSKGISTQKKYIRIRRPLRGHQAVRPRSYVCCFMRFNS